MPIDYKKYPLDWLTKIRPRILKRAKNRCEFCGAINYEPHPITGSIVILTVAHLDHDIKNNDDENLMALCQKCHNSYDIEERIKNRRKRLMREKEQAGQREIF